MMRRMLSGAMAVCLLFLLAGCKTQPEAVQPLPSTVPAETQPQTEEKQYLTSGIHTWQYLDENQQAAISQQGQEWTLPGYDSRHWSTGYGPFGAKDGMKEALSGGFEITTLLKQYDEAEDNRPSYFFRTSFTVEDPLAVQVMEAEILYDDSAIVYLNGHQVFAVNVPEEGYESNFAYGAFDGLGHPETAVFQIPVELLSPGENILAVELHQSDKGSSDIYFDWVRLESLPGQVRTVYVGPGSDSGSVSLSWTQTGRQRENAAVLISKLGASGTPVRYEATQVERNAVGYTYRAVIPGLEKNCRYSCIIPGADQTNSVFLTGDAGDGTDLLMMGDPQMHLDDYEDYTSDFASILASAGKGQDLAVCFGDVASEAEDYPVYESFVKTLSASLLPTAMLTGNHDAPTEHLSGFVNLPNMSSYGSAQRTGSMSGNYWFDYGGNLFLCLNSNEEDPQEHRSFILEARESYRERYGEPNWDVVMMHHAIFSQGNNYAREQIQTMRENLAPLFSELDIDVVFSGHDHTYSRSYLMQGTDIVPYEGDTVTRQPGQVLYITLNSSTGAKYYDLSPRQDYTAFCEQKYLPMLTKVNITPNRLYIHTWETESGRGVDSFTLLK